MIEIKVKGPKSPEQTKLIGEIALAAARLNLAVTVQEETVNPDELRRDVLVRFRRKEAELSETFREMVEAPCDCASCLANREHLS